MRNEDYFYLGKNKDGKKVWLEKPSWDCGWYWGFGYLVTMRGNREPAKALDFDSLTHWDSESQKFPGTSYDWFIDTFGEPTTDIFGNKKAYPKGTRKCRFSSDQVFTLCELISSAYTLKAAAEILGRGSTHVTDNPCAKTITNKREANRINRKVLPEIFREIAKVFDQVDHTPDSNSPVRKCHDLPDASK